MALPDFQTFYRSVLELCGDGKEHTLREAYDVLPDRMTICADDLLDMIPSGTKSRFVDRVAWAKCHLVYSGLLSATGRGAFQITPLGATVLRDHQGKITLAFLEQYGDLKAIRAGVKRAGGAGPPQVLERNGQPKPSANGADTEDSPLNAMRANDKLLKFELAQELLEMVMACSPQFFERLVVRLLLAMGYGGSEESAARLTGRSGDGGVDGIIDEDRLGLDKIYIQAKRWSGAVPASVVREFVGTLAPSGVRKGVLITTSSFPDSAATYTDMQSPTVILVDGQQLAALMIEYGVGVREVERFVVKDIDRDFFEPV